MMASLAVIILLTMLITSSHSSQLIPATPAISAAPSMHPTLPDYSSYPPALSPDMMPVFPSPRGNKASPVGSMPIIPSSPSPPNPDAARPDSADGLGGHKSVAAMASGAAGSVRGVRGAMVVVVALGCSFF